MRLWSRKGGLFVSLYNSLSLKHVWFITVDICISRATHTSIYLSLVVTSRNIISSETMKQQSIENYKSTRVCLSYSNSVSLGSFHNCSVCNTFSIILKLLNEFNFSRNKITESMIWKFYWSEKVFISLDLTLLFKCARFPRMIFWHTNQPDYVRSICGANMLCVF